MDDSAAAASIQAVWRGHMGRQDFLDRLDDCRVVEKGPAGEAEEEADRKEMELYAVGAVVQIHGLTGAPEYNGLVGSVLPPSDAAAARGRCVVQLPSQTKPLCVRPANLRAIPSAADMMAQMSAAVRGQLAAVSGGE